jgi:hypothetical protein
MGLSDAFRPLSVAKRLDLNGKFQSIQPLKWGFAIHSQ